jgi:hypothetical protein
MSLSENNLHTKIKETSDSDMNLNYTDIPIGVNPDDVPAHIGEEESSSVADFPQPGRVDWEKFENYKGPIESVHPEVKGDPYASTYPLMQQALN